MEKKRLKIGELRDWKSNRIARGEKEERGLSSSVCSRSYFREFPGGPVVRTCHFYCGGLGSVPGQGTKIPQAMQHGQRKKAKALSVKYRGENGEGLYGSWRWLR